ncbi:MAG: FG-GAP repeat protein [Thermoplasmatota archaeon]
MRSSQFLNSIVFALILLIPSFFIIPDSGSVSVNQTILDLPSRKPIDAGTVIKVSGGSQIFNSSCYFPVPKASTLESLNISISPVPYIEGGNRYPSDMWFNVSGKKMYEYPSSNRDGYHFGQWGRQNVSLDGRDSGIMMDTSHSIPPNFDIILPKNATITDAVFNITGHQRDVQDDWRSYYYEGSTGETTGYSLTFIDDTDSNGLPEIIAGSPTGSNNFGLIAKYEFEPSTESLVLVGSSLLGSDQYSLFGYSLSDTFSVAGKGTSIAVGAPKGAKVIEGTVSLVLITSLSEYDILKGNDTLEGFGTAVQVGDIDTDGEAEIVVGSPMANSGRGKIYILDLESPGDFSAETSIKTVIDGPVGETGFGKNITIGDVDGDKIMDIAVSSDEKVRIFTGGLSMDIDTDYTIDPISSGGVSSFGHIEFIGDTEGSGEDTLAVGCPGELSGAVLLYDTPSSGSLTLDSKYTPSGSMISRNFGYSISSICDYDKDGNMEFAISSVGDASSRGSIGIYQFDSTDPEKVLTESSVGSMYGTDILLCADMISNGYIDVVAGATYNAGPSSISNGRIYLEEYFDSSTLGENTPTMQINGIDAWTYSGPHLTNTATTSDLKNVINNAVSTSDIVEGISTPYNEYVSINLALTSPDIPNLEGSKMFSVDAINIRYEQTVHIPDLAGQIEAYIANPNVKPESDGNYHIPFLLRSKSAGGIKIDTVVQDFDYPPVIENPIQYLSLKEDTHDLYLLDLWHVFEDDKTPDEDLSFVIVNDGENRSMVSATIWEGRYLSIDAFNDTSDTKSNDNWTGKVFLTLVVRDGLDAIFALEDLVVEILPVNDPPMLSNEPEGFVFQDDLFEFIPEVVDAEGDEHDMSLSGPGNMSLVENININWYPNNWDVGNHTWTLTLSDGLDQIKYVFDLDVINVNDVPYFVTLPPVYNTVYVGETFTFDFDAEDIDPNDSIKFEIVKGLQGSLIDESTGVFTWTPIIYQYDPVEYIVRVSDNFRNYTQFTFYINLTLRLLEPEITSEPETILYDMMKWEYEVVVYDPNDDIPLVQFMEGPRGMKFSNITNILTWRPLANQTGVHTVKLRIISSGYTIAHTFNLTVQRAIRIWDISVTAGLDGKKISGKFLFTGSYNVTPSDVEYVQVRIDDGAWINATILEGRWSHEFNTNDYENGKHTFSVRAFDGHEWSQTQTIEVTISNSAVFPVWLTIVIIILIILILIILIVVTIYVIQNKMKKSEEDQIHKLTRDDFDQSRAELDRFLEDVGRDVSDDIGTSDEEVAPMDLGDLVAERGVTECTEDTKIFDKQSDGIYELGGMEDAENKTGDVDPCQDPENEGVEENIPQQEPPQMPSDVDKSGK